MNSEFSSPESSSNIVDFASFKKKKHLEQDLARGRNPLFVSHKRGTITDSKDAQRVADTPDMGDRLQRIRTSLQKINILMAELRQMSGQNPTSAKGES
jgi:hypothetical protein